MHPNEPYGHTSRSYIIQLRRDKQAQQRGGQQSRDLLRTL